TGHLFSLRLQDGLKTVYPARVVDGGFVWLGPFPNARNIGTLGRLGAHDLDGRVLFTQIIAHTHDGTGSAHGADKMGDAPMCLCPDLWPGGIVVRPWVVDIGELIEHNALALFLHLQ